MTNEEVIGRLESANLPAITLDNHRRELRAALLAAFPQVQARKDRTGLLAYLLARLPLSRTVIIVSAACVVAVLVIALSVLLPKPQLQSTTTDLVQRVLASKEVKAALGNDVVSTATVSDIGNQQVEVLVESQGGAIIIARVDIRNRALSVNEITYIALVGGSLFEREQSLTGEELDKVIAVARSNQTFRELTASGASINQTAVVEAIAVKRLVDTGESTQTREKWAMIDFQLPGSRWGFLVSVERNKVIDRGERALPRRDS